MNIKLLTSSKVRSGEGNKLGGRRGAKASAKNFIRKIKTVTDVTLLANQADTTTEIKIETDNEGDPEVENPYDQDEDEDYFVHDSIDSNRYRNCVIAQTENQETNDTLITLEDNWSDPGTPVCSSTLLPQSSEANIETSVKTRKIMIEHKNDSHDAPHTSTEQLSDLRRSHRRKRNKTFSDIVKTSKDLRKSVETGVQKLSKGALWRKDFNRKMYGTDSDEGVDDD